MTTEEANDFFVFRDGKSGQNLIRAHIKHNTINKNVFNYCMDNDSEIRIPALLFLGGHPDNEQKNVKNFFLNSYRKQIGCHAFIQSTGGLCCALCYLDLKNSYKMSEVSPISSVYPCFRNTGGPFLMGMLFARSYTFNSGHRTFSRQVPGVQQGSGGVFDIEEDFLHSYKRYEQTGVYNLKVNDLGQPQTPFPNWNQELVFAIYVCRGARLIVCDDRCYWSKPDVLKKAPQNKRIMDRSLLQEGSLVIFEGCCQLTLGFEANIIDEGKESVGGYFVDFRKASLLFKPGDKFLGDILSGQNKYVIFLGSNDSQHNSICWQLLIRTNHTSPKDNCGKVDGFLLAPDGGRILDIQPWNIGFEHIYWKHRYQRLYRSVLKPEPSIGRLGFGIPPEEIMKRILGLKGPELLLEIPSAICKPPPEYHICPPEDNDIRKYLGPTLEMSVKRDTWAQLNPLIIYPPPAPPLYPPIWDSQQNRLKYLGYGTRIKLHSMFKREGVDIPCVMIDNEIYIVMKKRTDDCVWESDPKRSSLPESQQLSPYEYRLGSDYLFYHKTNIKIGILGHYYFDGPQATYPPVALLAPKIPDQEQTPITTQPPKVITTTKPNDTPNEKEHTRPHTPLKGKTANKPVSPAKGKPPKNTQKGATTDQKQAAPPEQRNQHQKNDKKKGQDKNKHGQTK